jgi:KDO2-lipid IV(A) lauroyltransferase
VAQPPFTKRLRRFARYFLLRAFLACVGWIPVRWAARFGEVLGGLVFALVPRERAKALASLQVAFPRLSGDERMTLARACFRHLGRCAMEMACLPQIDARMPEYVEFPAEAKQLLQEALNLGKGVLFISGHVGHWELLARRVAYDGFPCQSIAKEASDPRTTAFIQKLRDSGKVGSLWRGHSGVARQMLRALRGGEILGLVIDQDTRVQSVFVPFFGVPAATPRAAADLALRTEAPVLAGFCQRETSGRYRLYIERVSPSLTGDAERDVVSLTAAMSDAIEAAIRRHPEQWVWMHQRWKTQPLEQASGASIAPVNIPGGTPSDA